ncbi:MAG: hypothetical protein AAF361_12680, partial [Bacteroidota bacterium]
MTKRVARLFTIFIVFIVSCSDETTVFKDDLQEDVILEENEAVLQSRLSFDKSGVLDILEEETITNKSSSAKANDLAGDYPLTLVAQVNPPSYNGSDLAASHIDIDGDYAYVSYNTAGEVYFGGIQIIDIGDPNNPSVRSQIVYLNADLNSIAYSNGYVYVVGGVNAETSATATSNSFIGKIRVSNGRLSLSGGVSYAFQQGFNANDVKISGSSVLVTSGRDGTLTSYSAADLSVQNEISFADLRSVAVDNGNIALLDAGTGIRILDNGFQPVKDIPISTDFGGASKRTLDFSGDRIVVPEAANGAGVYSLSSGSLLEYIPILINPDGVAEADIVTVGTAANDDIILMANGGAGLCLVEKDATNNDIYGIIELDGSTNYVATKGDYVISASGREGVQVIKLNKPSESLAAECATLPVYSGSSKLTVNSGDDVGYTGAKRFNNITVNGSLLLCGSWTSNNRVNINSGGVFEMNGTLVVAR